MEFVKQVKAGIILGLFDRATQLMLKQFNIGDVVLAVSVEALVQFVEQDGLKKNLWLGPEGAAAEFEINQCYLWFKNVRPELEAQATTQVEFEDLENTEQKYLERLIKVRRWLR